MHQSREAIRQRLATMTMADLTKEAVAALLNEHESKDHRGRPTTGATQYVGYIIAEWRERGLTAEQWTRDCLEAGRAELRRRREVGKLPPVK